jgi:hypothetical protein
MRERRASCECLLLLAAQVDIFLKIELEKILKTYMVNDKRAVHDGLMKPNPSEYVSVPLAPSLRLFCAHLYTS